MPPDLLKFVTILLKKNWANKSKAFSVFQIWPQQRLNYILKNKTNVFRKFEIGLPFNGNHYE